jgi:hypothetical protein
MAATIQLPENLASQLEDLARKEEMRVDDLIRRLIAEHESRPRPGEAGRRIVSFPLISKEEAPVVRSFTGAEIDELFTDEDLASGR